MKIDVVAVMGILKNNRLVSIKILMILILLEDSYLFFFNLLRLMRYFF